MLNRSASLAMSRSVLKALPGKLDIKRHSPSILYLSVTSHINFIVACWPDKRCLSKLRQVPLSGHHEIALLSSDMKIDKQIASLTSEPTCKLTNGIPGLCLLISSLPGKAENACWIAQQTSNSTRQLIQCWQRINPLFLAFMRKRQAVNLLFCREASLKRQNSKLCNSTRVLKALPGKLDIKRHLPSNLCNLSSYVWLMFYPQKQQQEQQ